MASRSAAVAAAEQVTIEALAGTPLTVGGERVQVGRLTANQWIAFSRWALRITAQMSTANLLETADAIREQGTAIDLAAVVQTVLPALEEPPLIELYSLLTGLDEEHCRATFDLVEFLDVVTAVGERNDPARIAAAFTRAARGWRSRSQS